MNSFLELAAASIFLGTSEINVDAIVGKIRWEWGAKYCSAVSSTGNTTVNNGYASSAQYPNKNILCLNCFHDIFFIPPTLIVLKPPFFVLRYIGEIMWCKRNKESKLSGADFPGNTTQPNKVEVPAHWGNQKLYVSSATHNLVFCWICPSSGFGRVSGIEN